MGSINLRIDDELKARSYAALEKMGVTPSEALRLMLEYIADNERLPCLLYTSPSPRDA